MKRILPKTMEEISRTNEHCEYRITATETVSGQETPHHFYGTGATWFAASKAAMQVAQEWANA
jgi:hypothetical protein